MIKLLLILILFFLSRYSFAQTDTGVRTRMEAKAQSYSHYELSNLKVTEIYNQIITVLDSANNSNSNHYKQKLTHSHDAWVTYSSDHCAIEAYQSRNAATGGDIFYHNCISNLNEKRIEELEELLINLQEEFNE